MFVSTQGNLRIAWLDGSSWLKLSMNEIFQSCCASAKSWNLKHNRARILEQSWGARNRAGIGSSYRAASAGILEQSTGGYTVKKRFAIFPLPVGEP